MSGLNKRNVAQRAAFEETFTNSTCQLVKMSSNCKFHYAVILPDCQDRWLPITFVIPDAESRFRYLDDIVGGVIILWVDCESIAVYTTPAIKKQTRVSDIVVKNEFDTFDVSSLVDHLLQPEVYADLLMDKTELADTVTHGRGILAKNQKIEAIATNYLIDLFHGTFYKTKESCLADAYYIPVQSPSDITLPVQLKCSQVEKAKFGFSFGLAKTYDNMLMILRHIPTKRNIVAPGSALQVKGVGGRWDGKYAPFVVEDDQIVKLLDDIYSARLQGLDDMQWPNSTEPIHISSIKLQTPATLNVPQTLNCQKEQHFAALRRTNFPNLTYTDPPHEAHTVDVSLNDVGIQDKTAGEARTWWQINVFKHNCRRNGKNTKQPYAPGDFEVLYIHVPGDKLFYLVPSSALSAKGCFKTDECPGKQTLCFYPFGNKNGKANTWLNEFLHSYDDEDVENKVSHILADIKSNRV